MIAISLVDTGGYYYVRKMETEVTKKNIRKPNQKSNLRSYVRDSIYQLLILRLSQYVVS